MSQRDEPDAPILDIRGVAKRFEGNFRQFEPYVDQSITAAGIHAAA